MKLSHFAQNINEIMLNEKNHNVVFNIIVPYIICCQFSRSIADLIFIKIRSHISSFRISKQNSKIFSSSEDTAMLHTECPTDDYQFYHNCHTL